MDEQQTRLADLHACLIGGRNGARLRVVLLHGYDMRPADLTPFAHSLGIPGVAYAFPQAPVAVSSTGFAWWPQIASRQSTANDFWQDYPAGRERARALLGEFLGQLRDQDDAPLMLVGFSQGGMLACDMALMEDSAVSALGMMSSSCIAWDEWISRRGRLAGVPAFVSHGRADPVLSFAAGQRVAGFLTSGGAQVAWSPFEGGHEIPFSVWRQFKRFIQAILHNTDNTSMPAYETH